MSESKHMMKVQDRLGLALQDLAKLEAAVIVHLSNELYEFESNQHAIEWFLEENQACDVQTLRF